MSMARFKLIPYSIRVSYKGEDTSIPLNEIPTDDPNEFKDFYEIFKSFCKKYEYTEEETRFIRKTDSNRVLFFSNYCPIDDYRLVYGTIKSGDYGYETDFLDIRGKKLMPSARKRHHSEVIPFFFLLHLPLGKNKDRGFLILEFFKNQGIKSILQDSLENYLHDVTGRKDLRLKINPMISHELIRKLESAKRILEVKFIKREIPRDVAEKNLVENYKDIYEERSFKIKRNKSLKFKGGITERLIEQLKEVKYPYFEISNEKYDEIKIVVEENGSTHTLTIKGAPKLREQRILSPKELEFQGGFPKESSILPIALSYLNSILEKNDERKIPKQKIFKYQLKQKH